MRRAVCRLAAASALLGASGCQPGPTLSPEETARRWIEAGIDGDVPALADLTCLDQRQRLQLLGEVSARNDHGDVVATREALEDVTFQVVSNDGRRALVRTGYLDSGLLLVVEEDVWRVCPTNTPT
jgi:hypothetical protein